LVNNGDIGRQLEEGAVGSSASTTIQSPAPSRRIGAVGIDDAAIDHGRVEAAAVEQRRHHRRGRGLAVRAGDGDAGFQPHQFRQHLGRGAPPAARCARAATKPPDCRA